MVVDHICVNYGAGLFREFFTELQIRSLEQNVFYPRNTKHRIADMDTPYRIESPLILGMMTKISFSVKQRRMRQAYDPLFHRNKPDLIHAHTLFSDGALANYYYGKYGTPFVVAIRSSDMDVFLRYKPWLFSLGRQIIENAGHIVFISPSIKKKFLKRFGEGYESKSMILPNGINSGYFQKSVHAKKEAHRPPELLYVGSFLKRKQVPALIKLARLTGARLTIAGQGGGQEKKVLRLVRSSDMVNYLGPIKDAARLSEIYRQCDIFVMASRRETFGLVYLEAMSQGLPLIYSKNTGIDGLFKEGSVGYGVRPGSIPEMKSALEWILAAYREISGNCISEAIRFNWTEISERYLRVYARVTA